MAVSVTVTSGEGLAGTIQAGPHRLAADEPAGAGGTDTGPNPTTSSWPCSAPART